MPKPRPAWWLLGGLLLAGTAIAAAVRTDPWPSSPVLTRLFALPASKSDVKQLAADLDLSAEQVQGLRQLTAGEARSAKLGEAVQSRAQAQQLNTEISAMRTEKDRKARMILGDKYAAFRIWIREWWARQVGQSRQAAELRQAAREAAQAAK
ncbi:hypothetical protein FNU79_12265 [Deinococcus detaillensis]|uniref:Periplasmic heavy metal sensor n=1 Tax=Deinococcus detaillensis TaxID=2592048 RepID=A0A553USC0_9DEIO|nr:hypothetical protein [Deinococcus detaillensis]TSA83104.1 hypothetical protein FNU79_12265 [Deinococcus detaillensis]